MLHTMKVCNGTGDKAPHILNLSIRMEVTGQLHALNSLPWEKEPPVSIYKTT
jgi:hypothetical protein